MGQVLLLLHGLIPGYEQILQRVWSPWRCNVFGHHGVDAMA
jgi:hypothetical protein